MPLPDDKSKLQKQVVAPKEGPPNKPQQPSTNKTPTPASPVSKDKKTTTPSAQKDDRFKYELTYANGGFNNGVLVRPDKDGKANVEISLYGGGNKKTLTVGPLPPHIEKLVTAYKISADENQNTPEITGELQKYFAQIQTLLNAKVLEIFKKVDLEISNAVKETFTEINKTSNKTM